MTTGMTPYQWNVSGVCVCVCTVLLWTEIRGTCSSCCSLVINSLEVMAVNFLFVLLLMMGRRDFDADLFLCGDSLCLQLVRCLLLV